MIEVPRIDQKEFLQKIKDTVLAFDSDAEVILFGSRARGDYREDSDWDFLVLTNKKSEGYFKRALRGSLYDIELEYLQPVSAIIFDKNSWEDWQISPLFKNIKQEGIRI